MKWILITGALAALFALAAGGAEDGRPKVGDPAPGFRLNDQDGQALSLAKATKDTWVVLAFYPKAATPG